MLRLSRVAASGDSPSLWCTGFSLQWLFWLWGTGSGHMDFSTCSMGAGARGGRPQQLWHTGRAGGTWTLPRLGIKPGFPALAGRVLSTTPPGKSESHFLKFVSDGINVSTHVVDVMSINERMKEVAFHQLLFVQLSPTFRLAQLEPGGQRSITACTAVGGHGLM